MIITFRDIPLNQKAAAALEKDPTKICNFYDEKIIFSDPKDCRLIFLDLSAEDIVTKLSTSPYFIDKFYKIGIPKQINTIDLIISGALVVPDFINSKEVEWRSTFSMAGKLANMFYEKEKRDIAVRVIKVVDLEYDYTLVVSPDENSKAWKIYGIRNKYGLLNKAFLEGKAVNYDNLLELCQSKDEGAKLLWEGEDLEVWLSRKNQCFRASEVEERNRRAAENEKSQTPLSDSPAAAADTPTPVTAFFDLTSSPSLLKQEKHKEEKPKEVSASDNTSSKHKT